MTGVAAVTGPLVLGGYLLGTIPLERTRSRALWAIEAIGAVLVATIAWRVVAAVAPGGTFAASSAIGFLSSQVITVWQSLALWTGAAFLVGRIAPVWFAFRGGDGVAGATALTVVYAPTVFSAGAAGYALATAVGGNHRIAIGVAAASAATFEWVAWVGDLPAGWGLVHGPELTLWVAVVGGVVTAAAGRATAGDAANPSQP